MTIALGRGTGEANLPLPARFAGALILVATVFGIYELLGYGFGRALARVLPKGSPSPVTLDAAPPSARFGARVAFATLGAYIGVQLLAWVLLGIAVRAFGGHFTFDWGETQSASLFAMELLIGTPASACVIVWLTRRHASDLIRIPGPLGIGLVPVSGRTVINAAVTAAGFAIVVLLVAPYLAHLNSRADLGPLVQLARAGGWPRLAWAVLAVFLAPPVEEFLFRGVLFAGLARTWNAPSAAVIITILFVALHLPYTARYWPGAAAVTLLAVFLIALRWRTGSLVPGIAAHAAYNSVLVVAVYAISAR
jgi:membrane protease YdiL (CAAX protease family)